MRYRQLGQTDLSVSEIAFGAWGIGGRSYGTVLREEALAALRTAEEHGCNFVDTAAVYGDSEAILGEFLPGRRDRWMIATKYSGQPVGLDTTLNDQLRRLRTDYVDLYQLHWMPRGKDAALIDQLQAAKRAGKTRYIGISVYSARDIDDAMTLGVVDAIQLPCNLLEPQPLSEKAHALRSRGMGVIVRSALKEGFLTRRLSAHITFTDPNDERSKLDPSRVEDLLAQVEEFRFLEARHGSMRAAAVAYALSFGATNTVLLGTKSAQHAGANFSQTSREMSLEELREIEAVQHRTGIIQSPLTRIGHRLAREIRKILRFD